MQKFAFNQVGKDIPEVIGMTGQRAEEIINAVRRAAIDSDDIGELMENGINATHPKNVVEAMYLGYIIRAVATSGVQKPLQGLIQSFLEE